MYEYVLFSTVCTFSRNLFFQKQRVVSKCLSFLSVFLSLSVFLYGHLPLRSSSFPAHLPFLSVLISCSSSFPVRLPLLSVFLSLSVLLSCLSYFPTRLLSLNVFLSYRLPFLSVFLSYPFSFPFCPPLFLLLLVDARVSLDAFVYNFMISAGISKLHGLRRYGVQEGGDHRSAHCHRNILLLQHCSRKLFHL